MEPLEFVPHEIMSFDEKVLILGHEPVRARATDSVFETVWAHPFTLRAGKRSRACASSTTPLRSWKLSAVIGPVRTKPSM